MKQYVTYLNKIKKSCRNVKYPFLTSCRVRRVRSQRSEVSQVLTPDSTVYRQYAVRGEARGARDTEKTEGAGASRASMPYLLPFLVRGKVWTVMCMLVDLTSGLQGTQAWVSPDPGGWHRYVKSGDVMRRRAPHVGLRLGWTMRYCQCLCFSLLSNQKLQAVFGVFFLILWLCVSQAGYHQPERDICCCGVINVTADNMS